MRALIRAALTAAILAPAVGVAQSAEIRVLAVRAPEAALRGIATDFARESGHQVTLTIDSSAAVLERIKANEVYDAIIIAEPVMDQLDRQGLVNPETRERLAKTGDTPLPDAQMPETYEAALMSDGAAVEAARAFIRYLASPDARPRWSAAKLEPLADH
jgi:ABC-type molybdate transport system substrate-binding protein